MCEFEGFPSGGLGSLNCPELGWELNGQPMGPGGLLPEGPDAPRLLTLGGSWEGLGEYVWVPDPLPLDRGP